MTDVAPDLVETKPVDALAHAHRFTRVKVVGILVLYSALIVLFQWISSVTDHTDTVSIWYPVAGLIFAVIVYYGKLGALLAFCSICISHALTGDARIPFPAIVPYAALVIGAILLWRNIFVRLGIIGPQLTQTPRWAVGLMSIAVLSAASNTIFGELLLYATGIVPAADVFVTAFDFFSGDLIGIMSVAPFLTLAVFPEFTRWQRGQSAWRWRWKRAVLVYMGIGSIGFLLITQLGDTYKLLIIYLGAVPILLAAVRGRLRETCLAIFVLTLFLALSLSYANLSILRDMSVFLMLMMAIAYVVTASISTNRIVLKSLKATLDQRDTLAAEQQKLGQQVTRLQGMEALGTLAGGMAHELNNLLQPILTFSRAAETANDADRVTYLARIRTCALNAKSLVQDVLTFSRTGTRTSPDAHRITGDADTLMRNSIAIARKVVPATVTVTESYAADTAWISCAPSQLVQIIINLCRNAVDAKARQIDLATRFSADRTSVVLSVCDNGLGMDPQTVQHALEPFFTTKQIGLGTGLGLSVVYGIVQSWGGNVSLASAQGQGTTVTLAFPALGNPEAENLAGDEHEHGDTFTG
jgi:signal transduction histidine kinase